MRRGLALLVALVAATAQPGRAAEPEPAGYRGAPYQGEVPATLAGALVVDDAAAFALWRSNRVAFVDVLPRPPRPEGLPQDAIWRPDPHGSIPGAIWLPNTGYDALASETLAYLLEGLESVTGGDLDAPVLFFCKARCWMSWNAAKRALEHGYARVFWYPDGVDGWAAQGHPLEPVEPRS